MADKGKIKNLFPPGNTGGSHGAGQIEELDDAGVGMGAPYFVFITPSDVTPGTTLAEGDEVTFDEGSGRKATNVSKQSSDPADPADPADPIDPAPADPADPADPIDPAGTIG